MVVALARSSNSNNKIRNRNSSHSHKIQTPVRPQHRLLSNNNSHQWLPIHSSNRVGTFDEQQGTANTEEAAILTLA